MIYVTSYWQLCSDYDGIGPTHLISILGPNDNLCWPAIAELANHLQIECDDIQHPLSGYIVPNKKHISELVNFVRGWSGQGDLMIHCKAGSSRSTAAALIAMSLFNPGKERECALLLRERGPQARPSEVFLRQADAVLGLERALQLAARAMPTPSSVAVSDLIALPQYL